uniref:NACHT domain-containing protein n=1 Tax=Panagrolaimus davidi TaxID=227884 RepID=A0A914PGH2_9BILA
MIRKSTMISFQGKEILLDTFLNESESSKLIDSTTLQNIINGEKIIIGAPLQTFTEIESACYRPREIRLIEIEDILFKDKNLPEKNLYVIEGKEYQTHLNLLILSSMITPENHENKTLTFENRIFQHFFTNRGILYIFDGFDEINPDYGEMILNLVDALRINENNRICIASRTNYKTILEEKFNTFAYDIKPFDRNDQEIYLKQYWISKYKEEKGVEMPNQGCLSLYVKEVLDNASENIRDIIGIPLQTRMYAEVLQKKNNDVISDIWISCFEYVEAEVEPENLNISTKLNLTMLYEKFFKEKIGKYYLYEKGILERSKPDSKGLEKKEEESEYFYHKIFGYLALIGHQSDEETLLTEIEKRQINNWYTEFNDGRKKMGIIDNFKDSAMNPLFNHFTYAEYFAACYLIEKLSLSTNRVEVFKTADKIFEKDVRVFTECFLFKLKK